MVQLVSQLLCPLATRNMQRFIDDITIYCCAVATSFTQKVTKNKIYWGLWNLATIQKKISSFRSKLRGGAYFERPDLCQNLNSWWNDTNFCPPVCQRILLGVWGNTALNWLEYCSSVSVFLHRIYMVVRKPGRRTKDKCRVNKRQWNIFKFERKTVCK